MAAPRWLNRIADLGPGCAALALAMDRAASAQARMLRPIDLVAVLRDLPWGEPSRTDIGHALLEWRATAALKHALLAAALQAAGLEARLAMAHYRLSPRTLIWLPEGAARHLPPGGVADVWPFVLADFGGGETAVDLTWPAALAPAGFPVLGLTLHLGEMAVEAEEIYEQEAGAAGEQARERWRVDLAGEALPASLAAREALDAFAAAHALPRPAADGVAASLEKTPPGSLFRGS